MSGIGAEGQPAAAPLNRRRPPVSGFDKDIGGVIRTGRTLTAHNAGQTDRAIGISDHTITRIKRYLIATQQRQGFFRLRPPHCQATLHRLQIEHMVRAVQFQHHVIGNINQRTDRTQTRAL